MFNILFKSIFRDISNHLRFNNSNGGSEMMVNMSGDRVKKIDLECESIFIKYLENNNLNIVGYISEETDTLKYFKQISVDIAKDMYIVSFDPLDGSSNYTSNINTGSIYAIYRYNHITCKLIDVIHSGYCLYGINSVMVYTDNDKVIHSLLTEHGDFIKLNELKFDIMSNKPKVYSINESNDYDPEIRFLIQQYKAKQYNMRWVGTLVADAHRILLNDGIFYYPLTSKNPNGKIIMLYESIPLAYIFKLAGGVGLNSSYTNILDRISLFDINKPHTASGIILASNTEYRHLMYLLELYEINKQ